MSNRYLSEAFWVSNISKMDVNLADLCLTIPAGRTMNLLDSRHHFYTREQLLNSASSGSLFKKRNKIAIRKLPPVIEKKQLISITENAAVPSRRRSVVEVKEVYYEELDISDDQFAIEAADLTDENFKIG